MRILQTFIKGNPYYTYDEIEAEVSEFSRDYKQNVVKNYLILTKKNFNLNEYTSI